MLMLLLLFFSALLLASLSSFFGYVPSRSFSLCSPCWSRGSLLLPGWFRGDVLCRMGRRRCDRSVWCSLEGFACAHLCPITAISSPLSRIAGRFISQSSTWLLVGKAGWLASGTRGRLICQLRQFGPPLCGPPYRRPPAESSHGSYERISGFLQKLGILWNITTISILWVTTQTQLFLILITPKKNFPEQGSGLSSSLGRILGYPTGYSQHNTPNKW